MIVTKILGRLQQVKPNGENKWTAQCPAHDDHTHSFSVSFGESDIINLRCQAGCTFPKILMSLNLKGSDLYLDTTLTKSPTKKTSALSEPPAISLPSSMAVSNPNLTTFRKPGDTSDLPGLLNLHELFNKPPYTPKWLAYPFLEEGRLVSLYGPAKVGKSLFALELAASIASGRDFLGFPTKKSRVLYIDYENHPYSDIRPRLEAMGFKPDELTNLFYLSLPDLQALDSPAGGKKLHDMVKNHEIELVIVDTISRAIDGKENENDTWLEFYKHTGKILKRDGITFLRLDHTGKDTSKGPRGGSAKEGDVDASWSITKKNGKILLKCEQERMPVEHHELIISVEKSPFLCHKLEDSKSFESDEQRINKFAKDLDDIDLPSDATSKETGATIRQLGHTISSKLLQELVRYRKLSMSVEEPTENLDSWEDELDDLYKEPMDNLDSWEYRPSDSYDSPILTQSTPDEERTEEELMEYQGPYEGEPADWWNYQSTSV